MDPMGNVKTIQHEGGVVGQNMTGFVGHPVEAAGAHAQKQFQWTFGYILGLILLNLCFLLEISYFVPQILGNYLHPSRLKWVSLGTQTLCFLQHQAMFLYCLGVRLPPQHFLPPLVVGSLFYLHVATALPDVTRKTRHRVRLWELSVVVQLCTWNQFRLWAS